MTAWSTVPNGFVMGVPGFINQRAQRLPDGVLPRLEPLGAQPPGRLLLDSLRLRDSRIAAGEQYLQRLPEALRAGSIDLPLIIEAGPGRPTAQAMADLLASRRWSAA